MPKAYPNIKNTTPPSSLQEAQGQRILATYHIKGTQSLAYAKASDICLEQTLDLPKELIPEGNIRENLLGRIENFRAIEENLYEAVISYAMECADFSIAQTLNMLFGNVSMKQGIRLQHIAWPKEFLTRFQGPRFGRNGIRSLLNKPEHPLTCAALKPLGLSPKTLAHLAYKYALGGIDIVTDHPLIANAEFCSFSERVRQCAEAIHEANAQTGKRTLYAVNITGKRPQEQAYKAKELGASALLVAPALIGYDTVLELAQDTNLGLPILCHSAFQGSYVAHAEIGIAPSLLFGHIVRLMGGDVTIFPALGGRYSFSPEDYSNIAQSSLEKLEHIAAIFPCASYGVTQERLVELIKFFGKDIILFVTTLLYKQNKNIVESCQYVNELTQNSIKT